jgi:hypothetical protein
VTTIQLLYCHQCKKKYNVRVSDIELMKNNDITFDGKEYTKGCFFKDLNSLKRLINTKN